jgi:putative ABC transport system permease protein
VALLSAVIAFLVPFSPHNSSMLNKHLKTAVRFLAKHKFFSFINISGLTIGMTCGMLVALFIFDELGYDRQNKDADRIYRIVQDAVADDGKLQPTATTPPALAEAISGQIPEIEHTVRLFPRGWDSHYYVRYGEQKFLEDNICRADSSIFSVFTLPFVKGDPKTALAEPHAVILTESTARKYFGDDDPIGKILMIDDWQPRNVTAVIRDVPSNSHFKIDFLVPLASDPMGQISDSWNWNSFYTYVKLRRGASIATVENKLKAIVQKYEGATRYAFHTQPLTAIHLHSHLQSEIEPNSDPSYTSMFGTVAFLILLIATINYIHFTTAQSAGRAKDIGIRKVVGAQRTTLIKQFLAESVIISCMATVAAIILSKLALPFLDEITGKTLSLVPHGNYSILISFLAFGLFIGLVAGIYPALYLSSFRPVVVLKGITFSTVQRPARRKALVVAQLAISLMLVIGTIVVVRQTNYMQHAALGFEKDQLITVNDINYLSPNERAALRADLVQVPGVRVVSASDGAPGGQVWTRSIQYKGAVEKRSVNYLTVDEDFLAALHIPLVSGNNFMAAGARREVIVNEAAVQRLGIPSPVIGQQLLWNENPVTGEKTYSTIVGLVKNFHFTSMRDEIMPFIFVNGNNRQWKYLVKLGGTGLPETLSRIKTVWDKHVKSRPFQFAFLDDTFARLYAADVNFKNIFRYVTFIALFLSCLGLFSLSSLITRQRTKEIGIRKVLGASIVRMIMMLCGEYLRLVLIAAAFALPVAWWAMHSWLQNFAYRTDIPVWMLALAALLMFVITLFTVCFHTLRAAMVNPVKSLKSE